MSYQNKDVHRQQVVSSINDSQYTHLNKEACSICLCLTTYLYPQSVYVNVFNSTCLKFNDCCEDVMLWHNEQDVCEPMFTRDTPALMEYAKSAV